MKISYISLILFIILPNLIIAQNQNSFGFLPSVNINSKLPKDWFTNFKIDSRQELYKDIFKYSYKLTELSLGGGKKIGFRTKLAFGYQLSTDSKVVYNTFIQQMSHTKKYQTFILAHRFQTNQTLNKNKAVEYRLRYRLSAEIPLNGQILDPKELFVKVNNEYLNSMQGETYDLEIRIAGFLGFVLSPKTKIEIGIDNRIDSFINNNLRNRLWLGLNIYQVLIKP